MISTKIYAVPGPRFLTERPLFLTAYDFEQAFDSLWLEDYIISMKDIGVQKEYLQLIYKMNTNAVVSVQTPFGETSSFLSDPGDGLGS